MLTGDDESVHIWGIDEGKNITVLSDCLERWGQITCVKWLEGVAQPKGYTLCFGTGRGFILFYEKVKDSVCGIMLFPLSQLIKTGDRIHSESSPAGRFSPSTIPWRPLITTAIKRGS